MRWKRLRTIANPIFSTANIKKVGRSARFQNPWFCKCCVIRQWIFCSVFQLPFAPSFIPNISWIISLTWTIVLISEPIKFSKFLHRFAVARLLEGEGREWGRVERKKRLFINYRWVFVRFRKPNGSFLKKFFFCIFAKLHGRLAFNRCAAEPLVRAAVLGENTQRQCFYLIFLAGFFFNLFCYD